MAITVANADGYGRHDEAWSFVTTAGRIVVGGLSVRNWFVNFTPNLAMIAQRNNNPNGTACNFLFGGVVAGGALTAGANPGASSCGACIEIVGATMTGALVGGVATGNGGTVTAPAVTPTGPCIIIGFLATISSSNFTPAGGWTKVSTDAAPSTESDFPRTALVYRIESSPVGSYSPQGSTGGAEWAATSVVLYDATPPAPAGPVIRPIGSGGIRSSDMRRLGIR